MAAVSGRSHASELKGRGGQQKGGRIKLMSSRRSLPSSSPQYFSPDPKLYFSGVCICVSDEVSPLSPPYNSTRAEARPRLARCPRATATRSTLPSQPLEVRQRSLSPPRSRIYSAQLSREQCTRSESTTRATACRLSCLTGPSRSLLRSPLVRSSSPASFSLSQVRRLCQGRSQAPYRSLLLARPSHLEGRPDSVPLRHPPPSA